MPTNNIPWRLIRWTDENNKEVASLVFQWAETGRKKVGVSKRND